MKIKAKIETILLDSQIKFSLLIRKLHFLLNSWVIYCLWFSMTTKKILIFSLISFTITKQKLLSRTLCQSSNIMQRQISQHLLSPISPDCHHFPLNQLDHRKLVAVVKIVTFSAPHKSNSPTNRIVHFSQTVRPGVLSFLRSPVLVLAALSRVMDRAEQNFVRQLD